MKTFPTVIASTKREAAIEVIEFEGAHDVPNRDAVSFYFEIRLVPDGEKSRVAVMFSGTVMGVDPRVFGLPTLGNRETAFVTFAEAALGDYVDDNGAPAFTPSGVKPATVDCFSPHFQAWRDRPPATDTEIERYLFEHVVQAWKYGHASWTLGPSDLLRLNRPLAFVMRLVRLHEGDEWSTSSQSQTGITLTPASSLLRTRGTRKPQVTPPEPEPAAQPRDAEPAAFVYVDEARIADLRRLDSEQFDLRKLVSLCEELNQCYRAQCYHAVAALTRALMDHVPPLLGFRTFAEAANNYGGTRSFKDCMRRLEDAARKIADSHLHTPVRKSEILPTRVQVNFSNEVDVLLGEVIRVLQ